MSMLTYIVPGSWSLLTLLFTLNAAIYGLTKCRGKKKPLTKAPKPAGIGGSSSSTSQKNKSAKPKSNDAAPLAEASKDEKANVKDLDSTQDTKNSTKKFDGEKEKREEDKDKDKNADEKLKPKTIARNEKEQKIAAGETRKKTDYPTFNDVESDWDSDKEKDKKKKAEAKATAAGDRKDEKTKDIRDGKETEKKGKEAAEKDDDNPPAPKKDEAKA